MDLPETPAPTPGQAPVPASAHLATAAVRALTRAARVLEAACAGLSLPHYRVLAAVAEGDERASRLAARLVLGKPAISAAVESLCARDLLSRSVVPGDQRAISLRLTPSGARLLADVEAAMGARLEAVAGQAADRASLLGALALLGPAVDAWRAGQR